MRSRKASAFSASGLMSRIVIVDVEAFTQNGVEQEDSFDVNEAVFAPACGGEVFDEVPFDEVGGLVVVDVGVAAEFEFGFVFAGEADVDGAESVFEGIEAGAVFTRWEFSGRCIFGHWRGWRRAGARRHVFCGAVRRRPVRCFGVFVMTLCSP